MKTFRDYYLEEKKKPAPKDVWLKKMAEKTCSSKATVLGWANGRVPDKLTQKTIAKLLKARTEDLFPNKNKEDNENN